jgi:hypothetical protein
LCNYQSSTEESEGNKTEGDEGKEENEENRMWRRMKMGKKRIRKRSGI